MGSLMAAPEDCREPYLDTLEQMGQGSIPTPCEAEGQTQVAAEED